MLNYNLLCNNSDVIYNNLYKRLFILDIKFLVIYEKKRIYIQNKIQNFQLKRNNYIKIISFLKLMNYKFNFLFILLININKKIINLKKIFYLIKKKINYYILTIPNTVSCDTPYGLIKKKNIEIFRWGKIRLFNFFIKSHIDIGFLSNGLDFSSSVKLISSKFVVMSRLIALLYRALIQFMLDIHINKHGYIEYSLPYLVNKNSLYGTGQLPKFGNNLFYVKLNYKNKIKHTINDCFLIPTAEVPLLNLMRDEFIKNSFLPIKMVSSTPCFRYESNSYGKDFYGLTRLYQFDKVEIIQILKPKKSTKTLDIITNHAEEILKLLKLPYRKILLCTNDINFSSCKTYDIEVWLPALNDYKEISSCSNTSDFQTRRMNIKYRDKKNNKNILLNALNASGLAVGRTLMAILENYQMIDGRVRVPNVLRSYMGGVNYI